MIQLIIDGKTVTANNGATILDAARSAGIYIPTMCHDDKIEPPVSCFICVVKVGGRDNFLPACATKAQNGMTVDTCSKEVVDCRRRAIELMLSEHTGSCEAPCTKICPLGLDIPEVMRRLQSGNAAAALDSAMQIIRRDMPFPATLAYICPAPCQKGCRKAAGDSAVSIKRIHGIIAEKIMSAPFYDNKINITPKHKNVAIIGSGPAGLSAAYFLALKGYSCTIMEKQPFIGGTLRSQFSELVLPRDILDAEIGFMAATLGVRFFVGTNVSSIDEVNAYDAVIVASGLQTCLDTFSTDNPKIFACGSAVKPVQQAVRSAGQGKSAADSAHNYLSGKAAPLKQFFFNTARLSAEETESLAGSIPYINKLSTTPLAPNNEEDIDTDTLMDIDADMDSESSRCLQCDCGRKDSCLLRTYAAHYGARPSRYAAGSRNQYARETYGSGLVHEPGKCIVCAKCVNLTKEKNIKPGLALSGRGSDVHITAPFDTPFDKAMGTALTDCVKGCPTGALWLTEKQ